MTAPMEAMTDEQLHAMLKAKKRELEELKQRAQAGAEPRPNPTSRLYDRCIHVYATVTALPKTVWLLPSLVILLGTSASLAGRGMMVLALWTVVYLTQSAVSWMENSEWRQQLRNDAQEQRDAWRDYKAAAKKGEKEKGASRREAAKAEAKAKLARQAQKLS